MMARINPLTLKTLRTRKHWSQEDLAEKTKSPGQPKIDKQTISRLERGAAGTARVRTVQQLAKALGVEPDVLAEEMPTRESGRAEGPSSPKHQFNVRISRSSRNALMLVSQRYRIQPSQIVELAPFLFAWAAEVSLRQRREAVDRFERARNDLTSRVKEIPHLFAAYDLWDESIEETLIDRERASIEMDDIFGEFVAEETTFGISDAADPFSSFLQGLVADFGDGSEFNGWDPDDGTPDYRVCVDVAT